MVGMLGNGLGMNFGRNVWDFFCPNFVWDLLVI
jgi:hypothetical protein